MKDELDRNFIALKVKDEEDSKNLMKYLVSIREKHISYTELWREKNKILKYKEIIKKYK